MAPALAAAQSSTSYRITDQVFNNGGGPLGAVFPSSPGFIISLDAIGDMVGGTQTGSASFQAAGSFVVSNRPPGEVTGLEFADLITLAWDAEPSVGDYEVYRSEVPELVFGDTGLCLASQISDLLVYEPFDPDPGHAWFYLVTARNRLGEEGTKGYHSNGSERPNLTACF